MSALWVSEAREGLYRAFQVCGIPCAPVQLSTGWAFQSHMILLLFHKHA